MSEQIQYIIHVVRNKYFFTVVQKHCWMSIIQNIPAGTLRPEGVPWTFPKDPNVRYLQGTLRGPIQKLMIQWKNWVFLCNRPCITYLFLFLTGRTNIQKFQTGTSMGRLRGPVAGRPWDQVMGRSAGSRSKYFLNSTYKHFKLTLTGDSRLYSEW